MDSDLLSIPGVYNMPIFTAIAAGAAAVATAVGFSAAAATVAGAVAAFAARTLLTIGISKLIANRSDRNASGTSNAGSRIQLPPATNNKVPVVYGKAYVGGIVTDAMLSEDQKTMWYVLTIAEKTDTGSYTFGDVYIDGKLATFDGTDQTKIISLTTNSDPVQVDTKVAGNMYMYKYNNGSSSGQNTGQTAIQVLQDAAIPTDARWTSTDTMTNVSFVIVKIIYNQDAGTTNLPGQITFELTNSLDQPGSVLNDYMTNSRYGCGIAASNIDTSSLTALNTYSNETIEYTPVGGGTATQARYRVNGPVNTGENCLNNLQQLVDTCDSWLQYSELNGQWRVVINQSYTDYTTLSELFLVDSSILVGGIDVNPVDLNATYNSVECQYPNYNINDQYDYQVFDLQDYYPELMSPNEASNQLVIQYAQVNNYVQAAYLGLRRMLQSREDLVITFATDYSGIQVEAGDVIRVTLAEYGWDEKLFRVSQVSEAKLEDGNLGARITGFEYNDTVYEDQLIEDFIPEANTGLKDPSVIGTPTAPTISNTITSASVPTFDLTTIVPSEGIVNSMEFWYDYANANVAPTTFANFKFLDRQYYSTGPVYPANSNVTTTVSGLSTTDAGFAYYFAARAEGPVTKSSFSPISSSLIWNPTITATVTGQNFQTSYQPSPVTVPLYGNGVADLSNVAISLFGLSGAAQVDYEPNIANLANNQWSIDNANIIQTGISNIVGPNLSTGTGGDFASFDASNATMTANVATLNVPVVYKDNTGNVFNSPPAIVNINKQGTGAAGQRGIVTLAYVPLANTIDPGAANDAVLTTAFDTTTGYSTPITGDGAVFYNNFGGNATSSSRRYNDANAVPKWTFVTLEVPGTVLTNNSISTNQIKANTITANLLDANSVIADKIQAGAITTNKLDANSVTANKIAANSIYTNSLQANAITSNKISANSITAGKIAVNAVTTNSLDANSVTADKIAAGSIYTEALQAEVITAEKIRANAVTANAISADSIRTNSLQANSVTSSKIAAFTITANNIAAFAITTNKLDANSVTADKISANSIYTDALQADSITAGKIQANAITSVKIQALAITTDKLAALSVTTSTLAATAVTAEKIAANAIFANAIQANAVTAGRIAAGAVTANTIDVNAVTADKIQAGAITSAKIQAFAITANLLDADSVTADKIQAGAITSVKIQAGAVTANAIQAGAITAVKIDTNAVTADKIQALAITTGKLDAVAVTADKIAANAITTDKINAGAITAGKIAVNAVTANTISANAITADKIDVNAVTADKIQAGAITGVKIAGNTITGNNIAGNTITGGKIAGNTITGNLIVASTITSNLLDANSVIADKIAADAITAIKIQANAITSAKIAANAVTANAIAANAITAGKIAVNAVTANTISANAVTADKIIADAITGDKIQANAITGAKIAGNTITGNNIAGNTITGAKIVGNTITGNLIVANAITANLLDANSVIADKIAADAVTAIKIQANAVTAAKISANAVTANAIAANSIYANALQANAVTANAVAANSINANAVQANAITASKIASDSISSNQLTANAVTAGKIAANAVTAGTVAANAIIATNLAANSVTADAIAANAITSTAIAANAVTANAILAGSITTTKLAANAITSSTIDAGAITTDKLAANIVFAGNLISQNANIGNLNSDGYWFNYANGYGYFSGGLTVKGLIDAGALIANVVTTQQIVTGAVTATKSNDFGALQQILPWTNVANAWPSNTRSVTPSGGVTLIPTSDPTSSANTDYQEGSRIEVTVTAKIFTEDTANAPYNCIEIWKSGSFTQFDKGFNSVRHTYDVLGNSNANRIYGGIVGTTIHAYGFGGLDWYSSDGGNTWQAASNDSTNKTILAGIDVLTGTWTSNTTFTSNEYTAAVGPLQVGDFGVDLDNVARRTGPSDFPGTVFPLKFDYNLSIASVGFNQSSLFDICASPYSGGYGIYNTSLGLFTGSLICGQAGEIFSKKGFNVGPDSETAYDSGELTSQMTQEFAGNTLKDFYCIWAGPTTNTSPYNYVAHSVGQTGTLVRSLRSVIGSGFGWSPVALYLYDFVNNVQTTTPLLADLYGVTCDYNSSSAGRWVAVGQYGVIYASTDNGANWVQRQSPVSTNLNAVTYDFFAAKFIAVGDNGVILESTNTTTWTQVQVGITDRDLNSIDFHPAWGTVNIVGTEVIIHRPYNVTLYTVKAEPSPTEVYPLTRLTFFGSYANSMQTSPEPSAGQQLINGQVFNTTIVDQNYTPGQETTYYLVVGNMRGARVYGGPLYIQATEVKK